MNGRYILQDKNPIPCDDLMEWARWMEIGNRRVAETIIGDIRISTVFLGLDHAFGGRSPLLFETMAFEPAGTGNSIECERCCTWEEAEKQHEAMVEAMKAGRG